MAIRICEVSKTISSVEDRQFGNEPGFIEHVRSDCARLLAETIIKDTSVYRKIEDDNFWVRHVWFIGVENNKSEIENRLTDIRKGQEEIANKIVELATKKIENWGSFYGHHTIHKNEATRFLREAIKEIFEKAN